MWIEILITLLIVVFAGYIIYKNLRTISTGDCGCGNCSSKRKKAIKNWLYNRDLHFLNYTKT